MMEGQEEVKVEGKATLDVGEAKGKAVVNVLLVDFHHKFGPVVEFSTQPIVGETAKDGRVKLPAAWKHLAFLALPDGLHNHEEDITCFTLPDLEAVDPSMPPASHAALEPRVYGVAVSRQIETTQLQTSDDHVTRNTVLKSICVLSTRPAFTTMINALRPCTSVLFDQRDFSNKEILHQLEASLERSLASTPSADLMTLQDFNLTKWLYDLRYILMQVYKLMLLQKKILICDSSGATSARALSSLALALASLVPGALDFTLDDDASDKQQQHTGQGKAGDAGADSSEGSSSSSSGKSASSGGARAVVPDTLATLMEASIAAFAHRQEQSWLESGEMRRTMSAAEPTLPPGHSGGADGEDADVLTAFAERTCRMNLRLLCPYPALARLFPYACLQQADELRGGPFLACPTNMMMVDPTFLGADAVLDLSGKPTLKFLQPGLKAKASLSTPDLRFIDQLVSTVRQREATSTDVGSGYAGGDEHIRHSFHTYLLQAAICADTARAYSTKGNLERLTDFNWDWFTAWRSTMPYARWCAYSDAILSQYRMRPSDLEAHRMHVCAGSMQVADVGRRLRQLTTTQLGAERTEAASQRFRKTVNQSEKALSEAYQSSKKGIASAVTSLRSWWGNVSQQQPQSPARQNQQEPRPTQQQQQAREAHPPPQHAIDDDDDDDDEDEDVVAQSAMDHS